MEPEFNSPLLKIMNQVETDSFRAWMLAARPKTLTGAAAPVMVGGGLAVGFLRSSSFSLCSLSVWIPFCLALVFALVMQVTANMVNDYFDFKKGSDRDDRLGPERACAQGWITPGRMYRAIIILSVLALLIGLPLVFYGGWEMLIVGLACVVFCWLYTTHLSYMGLGDLLVIVFFGLVPVAFTFYVMTGCITSEVWVSGLAMGLCTDCLLIVNNYRDIEQDRKSGKRTLIVMVGKKIGLILYLMCGLIAVVAMVYVTNIWSLAYMPYLALHITTYLSMTNKTGRQLNGVLGATARNIFVFGLISAVVLMIE